jgi:hypothetical protein
VLLLLVRTLELSSSRIGTFARFAVSVLAAGALLIVHSPVFQTEVYASALVKIHARSLRMSAGPFPLLASVHRSGACLSASRNPVSALI